MWLIVALAIITTEKCSKGSSQSPKGSQLSASSLPAESVSSLTSETNNVCGTSQIEVNGRCISCSYGEVSNYDGSACVRCSDETDVNGDQIAIQTAGEGNPMTGPGMVKSPDGNNVANAVCVLASEGACGTSQIAVNGRCSSCSYGQVSNAAGDTCVKCSDESTNGTRFRTLPAEGRRVLAWSSPQTATTWQMQSA